VPYFLRHFAIVVGVAFGAPPNLSGGSLFGGFVIHDVFVFRGASGIDACHYIDGAEFGNLSLFVALKTGLGFLVEENFVARVIDYFCNPCDAILGENIFIHMIDVNIFNTLTNL
jgi:hypothetical protein